MQNSTDKNIIPDHPDSYFLDPGMALKAARQQNRTRRTIAVTGLQLCYYGGDDPITGGPENLVHVPLEEITRFFAETPLRPPAQVVFPTRIARDKVRHFSEQFAYLLEEAGRMRRHKTETLAREARQLSPALATGGPLRILAMTSRITTVMQHISRYLVDAFNALGHDAQLEIEANDMEEHDTLHRIRRYLAFRPHVVINCNHLNNSYLHPDVINMVWWQDPMPEIASGKPLAWRQNDFSYILSAHPFRDMLLKTGADPGRIQVQKFCIDDAIFADRREARENKIVFIGSSAIHCFKRTPKVKPLLAELEALFAAGHHLGRREITALAIKHRVNPNHAYFNLQHYVTRDLPVLWLCRQRAIPVEIYGRYWDCHESVKPFFKGEVPHGQDVAAIYNRAKYALSCHSQLIQTQRLAELGSCGCIPVVYDARKEAEPPFWEDQCLFFSTEQELRDCLKTDRPTRPDAFRKYYAYRRFAKRMHKQMTAMMAQRSLCGS